MDLQQRVVGDVHVLTPGHNLIGGKETDELVAAVEKIMAKGTPHVIIDLGEIGLVTTLGISALVRIHTSCLNRSGWLRLARVNRRIHDVLVITRLIMVFETYETVEEAMVGQIAHEEPATRREEKEKQPAPQAARGKPGAAGVAHGNASGRTHRRS